MGVSCKYMLVFFLVVAIPQSKPMSQTFQERSLLFSVLIAGFSCLFVLHSRIKRGDDGISVSFKSVDAAQHVNLGPHNSSCGREFM